MKKYLIYFIIVFGVTSCTTERKAIKFLDKHPLVAADYCAGKYPVVPTYIKGKDSVIEKTVTVKGDSIPCPPNEKGEVVKVKCPDAKVITRDVYRTDTITKENTAKLGALQIRYNDLDKQHAIQGGKLIREEKSANSWMWRFIGLAGIVGVYVLLRVRKMIPF